MQDQIVDEAEEIAAARGDVGRLRGIIGVQRAKVGEQVASADLATLNRVVDALQDLLDSLAACAPLGNDTVQPSVA